MFSRKRGKEVGGDSLGGCYKLVLDVGCFIYIYILLVGIKILGYICLKGLLRNIGKSGV